MAVVADGINVTSVLVRGDKPVETAAGDTNGARTLAKGQRALESTERLESVKRADRGLDVGIHDSV